MSDTTPLHSDLDNQDQGLAAATEAAITAANAVHDFMNELTSAVERTAASMQSYAQSAKVYKERVDRKFVKAFMDKIK
jgi:ABC-type transporter Mla subunit MlaD